MTSGRVTLLFLYCLTLLQPESLGAQGTFITGKVIHAASQSPIPNVQVRVVGGSRVLTSTDGGYRLTATAGEREVLVVALGFDVVRKTVLVQAGQTLVVDFALTPAPVPLAQVVTIGTRANGRTSTETAVPVDVVTATALEETGLVELWQAIQRLVPSLNVPHIPLGDDHVRPLTLRGLAPNQVLVLVDGKRRHTGALVQVSPATSGTTSTDINAIPASAIDRIEVLRDGAAARYGSDAIAGVINIVLKAGAARDVAASWGQVYSTEGRRTFRDGDVVNLKSSYGVQWEGGGYLTASGEFRDRNPTNRAYPDARMQYFAGDPRNDNTPVISSHEGNGSVRDFSTYLNAAVPVGAGRQAYAMAGTRHRNGVSSNAFFRRALDDRTVRAIHPDGYMPIAEDDVHDVSGLLGLRANTGVWEWDLSSVFGRNSVRSEIHNTNNVTLGTASPTDFYTGTVSANQWTSNLDLTRSSLELRGTEVAISGGAEFRRDGYRIRRGEPDSYRDGGVRILDGPSTGRLGAVGSQGMLGRQPVDELDVQRTNAAAYLDLEGSVSRTLTVNLVGRLEKYSGENAATRGKLAARYEIWSGIAVRGAIANGFRAPSLSQSYQSATRGILRLVNGVSTTFVVRTLPVNSEAAKLLGAKPLRPENSTHFSAGVVIDVPRLPTVTADFFAMRIDDRISTTNEFLGPQVEQIFADHGMRGIVGGRYAANLVDTKTSGVDIVANHAVQVGAVRWRLTGGVNVVRTRVTRVAPPPPGFTGYDSVLLNRAQRGAFEKGQPRQTILLTNHFSIGRFGVNLHHQRFGEAWLLDVSDPAYDQTVSAKWLTDLNVSYRMGPRMSITASAANLFDVYPDEWNDFKFGLEATGMSNRGIFRYPGGISPFGMNGRTLYFHVLWK